MSHQASGYKTLVDNGKEHRSDGLLKHLGQIDTSSLRVGGLGGHPALTGAGVETIYFNAVPANASGTIQSYDRDAQVYRDLNIAARNISLSPQSGGTLVLPPNSVGSAQLQANAAQQLRASYLAAPGNVYTLGPWVESVIQATGTFTGGMCRIEYTVNFAHSATGGGSYIGIGYDGTALYGLAITNAPLGGYQQFVGGTVYYPIPAGTHRVAVFVGANPPQLTLYTAAYSSLYVTEQR